jgi:hypothetical protein
VVGAAILSAVFAELPLLIVLLVSEATMFPAVPWYG